MSRTPWAELGLTTALLLNACGPAKSSGTEKPVGGDGVGQTAENLPIPTPNVITNSEGEIRYPTETYFASKLNVCVAHPFSKTGGAEMPSILVSCKPIPNLEANEVALRGDLVDIPENGFIAFTDNQGNDGYLNKETVMMSLQEIQTWVAGMSLSQVEKEVVGKVLGEARVTGENISVVFRQTLHTERDPNGDERLVDMGLSIGFQAGTKVSILDDTLQPFGKTDLLKDLQIAGVDVVANQVDLDEFILNVYPSDWVEVGDQRFVSPEFVMIMDQVAASGERFTLAPDGTIQDGAITVPGLFVDKNGTITLQIGGKDNYVILRVESLSFDDTKGVNVAGYTLDEATGLWGVEVETVIVGGVTMALSEPDENGYSVVETMSVDNDDLSEEQKELLVNQLNPEYVGFTPDEAMLYYDAENQKLWVGFAADPNNVIARQDIETGKLIWDYDKMVDENGENVLFRIAHTWEMKGVNPVDMEAAKIDSGKLYDEIIKLALENGQFAWGRVRSMFYLYDNRNNVAIGGFLLTDFMPEPFEPKRVDIYGQISFLDKQGNLTQIMSENFDCDTRFWK